MSIESDLRKEVRKKYEKEKLKNIKDYKEWLLSIAEKAGLTGEDYSFLSLLNELLKQIEFIDNIHTQEEFSDTDTLSRFMTYLESHGEKNADISNMATKLSDFWEKETKTELEDHDFQKSFSKNFAAFDQKIKNAYIAHTKFEKLLNDGAEQKERYYSFFQLNEKEDALTQVITFNESVMEELIRNSDLVKTHIIQQGNNKYSLSLGLSGTTTDIIDEIKRINQLRGEVEQLNFFEGIYREDIGQQVGLEELQRDFTDLFAATQGSQRRLITTSGASLKGNRITELLFNKSAIDAVNRGEAYQFYLDQVSSLVGMDVTYKNGGGTSVKTLGKSGVIQLMAHGSMKSVDRLFYNKTGRERIDRSGNIMKGTKSLDYMIEKGMKLSPKVLRERNKIIDEATLAAKKEFSDQISLIKQGLSAEESQGLGFSLSDFISDNTRSKLSQLDDDDFINQYKALTGHDIFGQYAAELNSKQFTITSLLSAAKGRQNQSKEMTSKKALSSILEEVRQINQQFNAQAEQEINKTADQLLGEQQAALESIGLVMVV